MPRMNWKLAGDDQLNLGAWLHPFKAPDTNQLSACLLYKIRTGLQLRTSVSNALGEDDLSESSYQDSRGTSRSWSRKPRAARLQANLDIKF